ncbi:DUF3769 domain-containing protein [Oscillatoria sp. CS-180]|uniref:DUF3769 domain-containing protein n=1 Tax=Oscillatoria sp. CS-180 TaxID=3021720 RepID=UPI00232C5604|nr:DUF3769 domain-containing protein [Oscillatoria sp. CS-180]MDB9526240.1 DUF3769 domain-containing protein [Oscillatoria sp. CS-180]
MPYLPPSDLSPPPIVQSVQTSDVSASTLEQSFQPSEDQAKRSRQEPQAIETQSSATLIALSDAVLIADSDTGDFPIPVDEVAPLATPQTQATGLQTTPVPTEIETFPTAYPRFTPSPIAPVPSGAVIAEIETVLFLSDVMAVETASDEVEQEVETDQERDRSVPSLVLSAPWVDQTAAATGESSLSQAEPEAEPSAPEPVEEVESDELESNEPEPDELEPDESESDEAPPEAELVEPNEPEPDELEPDELEPNEPEPDEPDQSFPRAATPEPFWSNGAVTNADVLLPPSLPTNRPPAPLDLTSDYQEFEPLTQIITARGNVVLRLGNGVLSADRLWANLENRYVLVEGNVVFTRGEQVVEADRGEYNLLQGQGSLFDARGELFLPDIDRDFGDILLGADTATPGVLDADPIGNVRSTGSITFGTGFEAGEEDAGVDTPDAGGFVRRIRFEADRLDFDAEGWYAQGIRLTNDPFSPPELELRGDTARLTRLTEVQDELFVENARLVFDQSFSIPLFRNRILLSRGEADDANPFFVNFGFDDEDRDGLFVERSFTVMDTGSWTLQLTPQLLVQRFAGGEDNDNFLSNFGLEADLTGSLGPTTSVEANASFAGLDFENLENRVRSTVRVRQALGNHSLNLEAIYRDRLFNGSLGFQDVQSSLGVVLLSPDYVLGDTGIILNYQASAQYITAETDRIELIDSPPPFDDEVVSLGRFQGSIALFKPFMLWQGTALPPTRDEGLRFTPVPRTPNIQLIVGGRGTYTYYTSDDTQESLSAFVGVVGELGHFSDDFFDSTVFNLIYTRSFIGDGSSPFLFDRNVDQNVLTGGIIQQIYGPFRLGFQTSVNLDTNEAINTDFVLEYSRRTYGIVLRFNPTQATGFIGFRLNEFGWTGRAARFGGADIQQVEGGVIRR